MDDFERKGEDEMPLPELLRDNPVEDRGANGPSSEGLAEKQPDGELVLSPEEWEAENAIIEQCASQAADFFYPKYVSCTGEYHQALGKAVMTEILLADARSEGLESLKSPAERQALLRKISQGYQTALRYTARDHFAFLAHSRNIAGFDEGDPEERWKTMEAVRPQIAALHLFTRLLRGSDQDIGTVGIWKESLNVACGARRFVTETGRPIEHHESVYQVFFDKYLNAFNILKTALDADCKLSKARYINGRFGKKQPESLVENDKQIFSGHASNKDYQEMFRFMEKLGFKIEDGLFLPRGEQYLSDEHRSNYQGWKEYFDSLETRFREHFEAERLRRIEETTNLLEEVQLANQLREITEQYNKFVEEMKTLEHFINGLKAEVSRQEKLLRQSNIFNRRGRRNQLEKVNNNLEIELSKMKKLEHRVSETLEKLYNAERAKVRLESLSRNGSLSEGQLKQELKWLEQTSYSENPSA